ncbi:adenylosuccinate synthetase [Flavobacteriaceae bacterium TK19130]|nr:adenylosuccinate synthetase [Thermobacterium salinum]
MIRYTLLSALLYSKIHAQTPTGTPTPGENSGIDLNSTADIIIYIILPIVFAILVFIWVRTKKQDKNK